MSKTGLQKSVDQLLFHDNKLSAESKNKLIKESDNICSHVFDFLGTVFCCF